MSESAAFREGVRMVTCVIDSLRVRVPSWVSDIHGFRGWTDSDDFPTEPRIWWLKGEVWVDMSEEAIFTHLLVKTACRIVLGILAEPTLSGLYFTDGALLSNFAADISGNPD